MRKLTDIEVKLSVLFGRVSLLSMINHGNQKSGNDSFFKPVSNTQNQNTWQSPLAPRTEGLKSFMEMEGGRGLSGFYRNPSEDLFLRSYVENSIGVSVPSMDMLGFKNLSQNLRTDSEELFKSWLTNGEVSSCIVLSFLII